MKTMKKQDIESYVKDLVSKPEPQVVPPRTYRKTGEYKFDIAMQDNRERCRGDRGGEFHPITIS